MVANFVKHEQAVQMQCPQGGKCHGQACMAWRIAAGTEVPEEGKAPPERPVVVPTDWGYCGMAGRPEL